MAEIDVTMCPDCAQKGRYEARILINGRGVYTCPEGHRWQDANEKPSSKGLRLEPAYRCPPCAEGRHHACNEPGVCRCTIHPDTGEDMADDAQRGRSEVT